MIWSRAKLPDWQNTKRPGRGVFFFPGFAPFCIRSIDVLRPSFTLPDIPVWSTTPTKMTIDPFKLIQIVLHFYDKRKHRIDQIENYLNTTRIKNPALSPVIKKILLAEKEDQIFSRLYGYSLPTGLRKILEPLVSAQNSPVNWYQIKAARPYLEIEKGKLVVQYEESDLRKNRLSSPVATLCLACGLALLLVAVQSGTMPSMQRVIVGSLSIPMIVVTSVVISWSVGFETALKIEGWLTRASASN